MEFSEVFLERMREKNLRTSDIAKLVGYTQAHCNDLLKGNRRWNKDTISKFCSALDLKVLIVPEKKRKNKTG